MTSYPSAALIAELRSHGVLRSAHPDLPETVHGVCDDSRRAAPGDVFVAIPGGSLDGHAYVAEARAQGASLAVVEHEADWNIPLLLVSDSRRAGIAVADLVYRAPASQVRLAGVTGTNGKTTTVHLARVLLDTVVAPAASLGTLGVLEGSEGRSVPGGAGLTTPGPIELRRVLRQLVDDGVECVVMEVSSHSLAQGRVDGLVFEVAAFTTFSRDHLDYHNTMEEYFRAKAMLLDHVAAGGTVVLNADDEAWSALPRSRRTISYGVAVPADLRAANVRLHDRGSSWMLEAAQKATSVELPLVGDFNVGNALAAAAIAWAMGAEPAVLAAALSNVPQVPGRLEVLSESPLVLRDYAHTPDALERSLHAARSLTRGRVTVVFGCGGDRDRGKRPLMGEVAARMADTVLVTSDNPRSEDPERIIDDIVAGLPAGSYEREEDRRSAIARAIADAGPSDVVLIAGKGHETYQLRGDKTLPFDEKQIVAELLAVRT